MTQQQQGGIGSTNIQVDTIHLSTGLSVADVKEIAKDVFQSNFAVLTDTAKQIADDRARELREELMEALAADGRGKLDSFSQPEKQVALLDAQRAYALTGDEELKSSLVRTVLEISKEPERSLKSIVLQEALKVLPTLTSQQMKAIAATFVVRYVHFGAAGNLLALSKAYERCLGRKWSDIDPTDGDFRHIEYSRCGSIDIGEHSFIGIIKESYPGIVSAGFPAQELIDAFGQAGIPNSGIMPCVNDPQKWQIAAIDNRVIDSKSKTHGWTEEQVSIAKKKLTENILDDEKLTQNIKSAGGTLAHVCEKWGSTAMKSLTLTSVGIAVAHSYVSGVDNSFIDLDIWL